jgi:hypothetical protein
MIGKNPQEVDVKTRKNDSGQALIAVIIAMSLVLLALLTALTLTQFSNKLVARQLTFHGQALNGAEAGITEALSWFRRRPTQPVATFNPALNLAASPSINETEDPTIGIVRTYQVSDLGRVMGRYEVRIGNATAGTGVIDITASRGKLGTGTVWQLESVANVWVQNDASKSYNQSPNQILSTQTVRTEIQRLGVNVPSAALFCKKASGVRVLNGSKIQGGGGTGLAVPFNTGTYTNTGYITGAPSVQPNSTYNPSISITFGVTQQELMAMADVVGTKVADLPNPLPSMSLMIVKGNAVFTVAQPMTGSGILVVFGDLTIQQNSNSSFNGVVYVTGKFTMNEPSSISGVVVVTDTSGANSAVINSSSDIAEIDYDPSIINQINLQMAAYRFSRGLYWLGK